MVADFGFARDVTASHVYERKSEGRLPIRWMAPESLYDNVFSVKSDVWSFGVLIWEVVTLGSTPYPGLSAAEVMKRVSAKEGGASGRSVVNQSGEVCFHFGRALYPIG